MKRLLLTALDDHNHVYYDLFIPFILSLRETDYTGDIGVIGYNLSEDKIKTIEKNGVKVFPGTEYYKDVIVDRQLTVADIAEHYGYDQIALYDSDIWFPQRELTVFDQIDSDIALYATYDLYQCTYITDSVTDDYKPELHKLLEEMKEQTDGHVWHVGVILGTRKAWCYYRDWVKEQLVDSKYLLDVFGVDTAFFNIYAAQHPQQVARLHERYNCTPVWGIKINWEGNRYVHRLNEDLIEGIHVTRAVRKAGTFSYLNWHKDYYDQHANDWRLKDSTLLNITLDSCRTPIDRIYTKEPIGLTLESVKANSISYSLEGDNTVFTVRGDSTIVVKNTSDKPLSFNYYWRHVFNVGPIKRTFIQRDNNPIEYILEPSILYRDTLQPGQEFSFVTREVNVEEKAIEWVLDTVRLI